MNSIIQFVYSVNEAITHSAVAKWIKPITRKLKIGRIVSRIEEKTESREDIVNKCGEYEEFYNRHIEDFEKIPGILEDDFSRLTLERLIEFRKTWNRKHLKDITIDSEYFQKDIFSPVEDEVFIDGGAYVGDTIERFIREFAGGGTKKYMRGNLIRPILNS